MAGKVIIGLTSQWPCRDRLRHTGGGVVVHVSSKLSASEFHIPCNSKLRTVVANAHGADYAAITGVLYHPPKPTYHDSDILAKITSKIVSNINVKRAAVYTHC